MLSRRQLLALATAVPIASHASHAAAARVVSVSGALPEVGYMRTLSAEGLLSLAPSMILASEEVGPPAVLRQLELARVPLHMLSAEHRFEGLLSRVERIGSLLDREAAARQLGERLRSDWQSGRQRVQRLVAAAARPPRVLFVLAHGMAQLRIAGRDTAADAVIAYAGARNALGGLGVNGYKQLTPEAAITAAPDVILTTNEGLRAAGGVEPLLQVPGLAQTPAGRARRIVGFDALELLAFGPRLPALLPRLAEALYIHS